MSADANVFSDTAFFLPHFPAPEHYAIAHLVQDSNQVPENQIFPEAMVPVKPTSPLPPLLPLPLPLPTPALSLV